MQNSLNGGAIHVSIPTLERGIELCRLGGFNSLAMHPGLVRDRDLSEAKGLLEDSEIYPGAWGVPFDWRGGRDEFDRGMEQFRIDAEVMRGIGIIHCATWILPGSNDMNFDAFSEFHRERLVPVAKVLNENGMSFGMEFIGPKTLRDSFRFPWIYTMQEMLKFGAELGENVGILLDIWHLFTSGGTVDQVRHLDPKRISLVHLNDAPLGVSIDELVDNRRGLPGATGVLPLKEFMAALRQIGYDGPVEAEPFDEGLKALASDEARVTKVGESMKVAFSD